MVATCMHWTGRDAFKQTVDGESERRDMDKDGVELCHPVLSTVYTVQYSTVLHSTLTEASVASAMHGILQVDAASSSPNK